MTKACFGTKVGSFLPWRSVPLVLILSARYRPSFLQTCSMAHRIGSQNFSFAIPSFSANLFPLSIPWHCIKNKIYKIKPEPGTAQAYLLDAPGNMLYIRTCINAFFNFNSSCWPRFDSGTISCFVYVAGLCMTADGERQDRLLCTWKAAGVSVGGNQGAAPCLRGGSLSLLDRPLRGGEGILWVEGGARKRWGDLWTVGSNVSLPPHFVSVKIKYHVLKKIKEDHYGSSNKQKTSGCKLENSLFSLFWNSTISKILLIPIQSNPIPIFQVNGVIHH